MRVPSKRYIIYDNYDPNKPVGTIDFLLDIPEEVLANCVIAPEVNVSAEPHKVISFGIFPKESLDTASIAERVSARKLQV